MSAWTPQTLYDAKPWALIGLGALFGVGMMLWSLFDGTMKTSGTKALFLKGDPVAGLKARSSTVHESASLDTPSHR